MIRKKNNHFSSTVYTGFIAGIVIIIAIFVGRVVSGSAVTPYTDGQTIMISKDYTVGTVYDRNEKTILTGTDGDVKWKDADTTEAFADIIGFDISETLNSRTTILGNCPWVFGTEDNRLTSYDLIHPFEEKVGGNVKLTINADLQEYIYSVIQDWCFEDAYVMVSDYTTGEILAAYGNVFTEAMHPGSTIKPIVLAAALSVNPKIQDLTYECTYENHLFHTKSGDVRINCHNGTTHGYMNCSDAIAFSCNGYFVHLMQSMSRKSISKELEKWGFDTSVSYSQFMYWDQRFTGGSGNNLDYLLAAIGQANAYITPAGLHICTSTLLNHGVTAEPHWLMGKQTSQTAEWKDITADSEREVCSTEVADTVVDMMLGVTERGTGTSFYLDGFAAKTGTAQISDTSDTNTIWTTGGLTDPSTPYCVTVCINNVDSETKSSVAGMIAQSILLYMSGGM